MRGEVGLMNGDWREDVKAGSACRCECDTRKGWRDAFGMKRDSMSGLLRLC